MFGITETNGPSYPVTVLHSAAIPGQQKASSMHGEFRIQTCTDGLTLLLYGPRDLAEVHSGVPLAAFALWDGDKMVLDRAKLAAFLNAALAASHGDFEPMRLVCPPKSEAA